ncbi:MAG: hypothetical protein Q8K93_29165 [Reyranella sp.]|uniref:hypothetical protein n=1 Tax=Reyranella sp. TaxID=1929291 RepID=UPI002731F21D|nr:hypothetical protein [Reyranella sp.]MDP1966259.1 hypothetical protein [Reyranella sp.]MDP2373915.1 hypothetical protein [Reyranella sp.]
MSSIELRLDHHLGSDRPTNIVATVRAAPKRKSEKVPTDFKAQRVVVPVGRSSTRGAWSNRIDLPPGIYLIEANLPRGGRISETVEIEDKENLRLDLAETRSGEEALEAPEREDDFPKTVSRETFGARAKLRLAADPVPSVPPRVLARPQLRNKALRSMTFEVAVNTLVKTPPAYRDPTQKQPGSPLDIQGTPTAASTVFHWTADLHDEYAWIAIPWTATAGGKPVHWEIAALPTGWIDTGTHQKIGADLVANIELPRPGMFGVVVTVRDSEVGSAMSYFTHQKLDDAGALIEAARDMLFDKMENPIAAAAGAYVLLALRADEKRDRWHRWVTNLNEWFPGLPDAAILKGWLHLGDKETDAARGAFAEAYARGVPLLSAGLRLLADGVSLCSGGNETFAKMEREIRLVGRYVDFSQPFTVMRVPLENP